MTTLFVISHIQSLLHFKQKSFKQNAETIYSTISNRCQLKQWKRKEGIRKRIIEMIEEENPQLAEQLFADGSCSCRISKHNIDEPCCWQKQQEWSKRILGQFFFIEKICAGIV